MILSLLLVCLIIGFLEAQSIKNCFEKLDYDLRIDKKCVNCDEVFSVTSVLENRRTLPLLSLHISEYYPKEMLIEEAETNQSYGGEHILEQSLYIMPKQRAVRTLQASLNRRGIYRIGRARITAGDLLGFKEEMRTIERRQEIVVYPRSADIQKIEPSFGGYLGSVSVKRFIMPDPIQTIGFREYTGREPQKDISWNQSLKRNTLMVRQYDYTAEQKASVIVDVSDGDEKSVERCYEICRSIIEYLEDKHIIFGFYTNAMIPFGKTHIPDGTGRFHLETILESLGRASLGASLSRERLFMKVLSYATEVRSYILICANTKDLQKNLAMYERKLQTKVYVVDALEEGEQ